jgi:hypothetical protein
MTPKPANPPDDCRCVHGNGKPKGVSLKRLAAIKVQAEEQIDAVAIANLNQVIAVRVLAEYLRDRPDEFAAWAYKRAEDSHRDKAESLLETEIAQRWAYRGAQGLLWPRN